MTAEMQEQESNARLRNREHIPGCDLLKQAFATVESFAAVHSDIHFVSGVCTPLCLLDTASYPHIRFTRCSTDLTGRPVTVNYNGDVRFCNHSPKVLGNLYTRPIGDILTDPDINAWYAAAPEECGKCTLLARCGGGCRAASEQVYGRFSAMDPIVEVVLGD